MSYQVDEADDLLTARTDDHDGVAVVVLTGEVDMMTEEIGLAEVLAALGNAPGGLVIDLQAIEFFGSSGVKLLLAVQQEARAKAIPLAVAAAHHVVLSPLTATGVGPRFRLFPDLPAALRELAVAVRPELPAQS